MSGGIVKARPLLASALAGVLAAGCGLVGNEGERQAAVVRSNCLDCHNATEQVAGLNLEALSSTPWRPMPRPGKRSSASCARA